MTAAREFLGIGWKFPVRIDATGGVALSRYEQDVEEAIWLVLSTAKGERVMRPDFGCGIQDYVFASNNPTTRGVIAFEARRALITWEPRIEVLDVRVSALEGEPNLLLIHVDYRLRSTNTFHNLVYPFYLQQESA